MRSKVYFYFQRKKKNPQLGAFSKLLCRTTACPSSGRTKTSARCGRPSSSNFPALDRSTRAAARIPTSLTYQLRTTKLASTIAMAMASWEWKRRVPKRCEHYFPKQSALNSSFKSKAFANELIFSRRSKQTALLPLVADLFYGKKNLRRWKNLWKPLAALRGSLNLKVKKNIERGLP